jgi:hypothetical protein
VIRYSQILFVNNQKKNTSDDFYIKKNSFAVKPLINRQSQKTAILLSCEHMEKLQKNDQKQSISASRARRRLQMIYYTPFTTYYFFAGVCMQKKSEKTSATQFLPEFAYKKFRKICCNLLV